MLDAAGNIDYTQSKLHLADNAVFVFGGDCFDKGVGTGALAIYV